MGTYSVRVSKDYLGFCAAHFIVFDNNMCERLHGHNYGVAAELEDDLRADHLIFDFIQLKKILKGITDELAHRMLVPVESDTLSVEVGEEQVVIRSDFGTTGPKLWSVPIDDCTLLPIANTTAELLAKWVHDRLSSELTTALGAPPRRLRVAVYESPGQVAPFEQRYG